MIGKAHDAVGVGDIDPLRIVAIRKEGDAERLTQGGRIHLVHRGTRRTVGGTKHPDSPGTSLRDEDVAIRRDADDARPAQSLREQFALEPRGNLWRDAEWPWHDTRHIRR